MGELEMPGNDRQDVKDKYMAIRYDFLIGFKDEYGGVYGKLFSGNLSGQYLLVIPFQALMDAITPVKR